MLANAHGDRRTNEKKFATGSCLYPWTKKLISASTSDRVSAVEPKSFQPPSSVAAVKMFLSRAL